MDTPASARTKRSWTPQLATLLLFAALLLVGRASVGERASEMYWDTSEIYADERTDRSVRMACHPMYGWLEKPLNLMVHDVVDDIPKKPRLAKVPFDAVMRVGVVETDITELQIRDIKIDDVSFIDCRTVRDFAPMLPRALPNVVKVHVHGIRVTVDMAYDSRGLLGFGASAGKARSTVKGEMKLTLAFLAFDDWHVSSCAGNFTVADTQVIGEGLGELAVPVPNALPFASIMCYGPGAVMDSGLVGLTLEGAQDTRYEGKEATFRGVVPMVNERLSRIAPAVRGTAQTLHVDLRDSVHGVEDKIPCLGLLRSCHPPPSPPAPPEWLWR